MSIKETITIETEADKNATKIAKEKARSKSEKPKCVVTAERLNIRFKPDPNEDILCVVKKGQKFTYQKSGIDGWVHVFSDGGIDGYCKTEFVKFM